MNLQDMEQKLDEIEDSRDVILFQSDMVNRSLINTYNDKRANWKTGAGYNSWEELRTNLRLQATELTTKLEELNFDYQVISVRRDIHPEYCGPFSVWSGLASLN